MGVCEDFANMRLVPKSPLVHENSVLIISAKTSIQCTRQSLCWPHTPIMDVGKGSDQIEKSSLTGISSMGVCENFASV